MENNENKTSQTILRGLVILGILAILVFLSIGIVRIVPRALNALSNVGGSISSLFKSSPNSKTATSTTSTSTGGFIIIGTSTPSKVGSSNSSSYSKSGSKVSTTNKSSGSSYSNSYSNSYSSHPSGSYSYGSPTYIPGSPDLAVTITAKGIMDPTSGQFIETNNFTTSDTVVIKFKIENRGTSASGPWNLNVTMPSLNPADQTRNLSSVASIPAGLAIEGKVVFSQTRTDNPTVTITADPTNAVQESNEANNSVVIPLIVSGSNYGNGNYGTGSVQPDLTIRNIQTGLLGINNQFIPTNTFRSSDRVAVRFEVANQGQNSTGPWYFRTELTDYPTKQYNSGAEASIAGNSSIIYTIAFDNVRVGADTLTIFLDPSNYLVEANKGNNTATVSFTINQ